MVRLVKEYEHFLQAHWFLRASNSGAAAFLMMPEPRAFLFHVLAAAIAAAAAPSQTPFTCSDL